MADGGTRRGSVLGWIAALAAFLVLAVISGLYAGPDGSTAYTAGRVVGRIFGCLVIALALRWLWVRFARGGRGDVRSPWTLAVAAGVALVFLTTAVNAERAECAEEATASELLAAAPGGDPLTPELKAQVESGFTPDVRDTITSMEGRTYSGGRGVQAFVLALVADEPVEADELAAGFAEGAGSPAERADLDGRTAYFAQLPDGAAIISVPHECAALTVVAEDRADAERRTRELLAD